MGSGELAQGAERLPELWGVEVCRRAKEMLQHIHYQETDVMSSDLLLEPSDVIRKEDRFVWRANEVEISARSFEPWSQQDVRRVFAKVEDAVGVGDTRRDRGAQERLCGVR